VIRFGDQGQHHRPLHRMLIAVVGPLTEQAQRRWPEVMSV
jgi:hypothetical protein